jgi:hypothetical protein
MSIRLSRGIDHFYYDVGESFGDHETLRQSAFGREAAPWKRRQPREKDNQTTRAVGLHMLRLPVSLPEHSSRRASVLVARHRRRTQRTKLDLLHFRAPEKSSRLQRACFLNKRSDPLDTSTPIGKYHSSEMRDTRPCDRQPDATIESRCIRCRPFATTSKSFSFLLHRSLKQFFKSTSRSLGP